MKLVTILIITISCILTGSCRREEPAPPQQPTITETEGNQQDAIIASAQADPVVQKTCPVKDQPIDPAIYTVYQGKKVFFSSRECIEAFENDPDSFVPKLPQFQQLHTTAQ